MKRGMLLVLTSRRGCSQESMCMNKQTKVGKMKSMKTSKLVDPWHVYTYLQDDKSDILARRRRAIKLSLTTVKSRCLAPPGRRAARRQYAQPLRLRP
eukprot:750870-Hanusia_phi.AAC.1